jgi:hypothetical protein
MNQNIKKQLEWETKFGKIPQIIALLKNGITFIAVGDKLRYSRDWKTFPDFLIDYLKLTFGAEWWKAECRKDVGDRHTIIKWSYETYEFQRQQKPEKGGLFCAIPTGPYSGLLHLAWDLYVLDHHLKLQNEMIVRLKIHDQFQGARYELYAAASCIRAGYDIIFYDEADKSKKHPEFIATHKKTGQVIAVEAKSRHRAGVLGQKGIIINYSKATMGNLINKALSKETDLPLVVFLDVNLPPSESLTHSSWLTQIVASISRNCLKNGKEGCFNLLIFTNIPHHYGDPQERDPMHEIVWKYSENPIKQVRNPEALSELINALPLYKNIPNMVF